MKRLILAISLMAAVPAFAQDMPASEASIRELLKVTDGEAVLAGAWGQLDAVMEKAMKDALGGKQVNAEQEKIMAEMRAETVEVIRSEMSWDKLEPMYIKEYAQTFTQGEVDGMIAFYKSDAGKAVTAKMPQLLQVVMQDVMALVTGVMPKLRAITEKYVARLKDAK